MLYKMPGKSILELITLKTIFKVNLFFKNIKNDIERRFKESESAFSREYLSKYMTNTVCMSCEGSRLNKEARSVKIDGKELWDITNMTIDDCLDFFNNLNLKGKKGAIAEKVVKELKERLKFLSDVGLNYLTLSRSAETLSGGEAQRIRLASQIGAGLVGVTYILDEPSIGLHQRDNKRLLSTLFRLKDLGNTVIVVEHDKETIECADHIIDIGPGAGIHGGFVSFAGNYKEILKQESSLTGQYLSGKKDIKIDKFEKSEKGSLCIKGCNGNNLKNVNLNLPLGKIISITGVSGSGKSTLINETLFPVLHNKIYRAEKIALSYKSIEGLENIDKIVNINQSPIGRTPRSNPATYCGVFGEIRNIFSKLNESVIRGYKPGRFSFNVPGGRCEECKGAGLKQIEMNFLPDVYVECESCMGKRFNRETLEIKYKGKSINDILNMSVNDATDFFEHIPKIFRKLKTIRDVGLGYLTLGQQSTTLSGGEAQRIKLATELSKRDTGNTLYVLDEPTTGLHFEDIRVLLGVIETLINKGNSVIIIEHNMDVIKKGDYIVDLGPEGGKNGGKIIFQGYINEFLKCNSSLTADFLKKELT